MNTYTKISLVVASLFVVGFTSVAYAIMPLPSVTLSATSIGTGDSVQIVVTAVANSSVALYSVVSGSIPQGSYVGTTNSNGYLTTTISSATYGITSNTLVYAVVNNVSSPTVVWPSINQGTAITFSQTNPTISVGQSTTVYIYGGSGTNYYISSNSNSNIVQATIAGSSLSLYGVSSNGSAVIAVCSSSTVCASITATVGYSGGVITLSQTSVSLVQGQSTTVSITGNGGYYFSNYTGQSIATVSISGNNLIIYANSYGSANVSVCQAGGQCAVVYISVTNNNQYYTNTSLLTFSQDNPTISIGQSMTISILGGSYYGGYTNTYRVAYNSDLTTVQPSIGGNTLTIYGIKNGVAVLVICDLNNNCGAVSATVGSNPVYPVYTFTSFLTVGSSGAEVIALQQLLTDQGYYGGAIAGHYGYVTAAAVRRYQAANGLMQTGNVGPSTRNVLNSQGSLGLQE